MKGNVIALDHWNGREAAALMVDGQLEDILIDADLPRPGTIYRATADRPVKGQGGMFLTTPDGTAFLRQVKGLKPGQSLLVQVTGYAEPGKAIPVTQRILFKSRYAIVTPEKPGINVSRQIKDDDMREAILEIAHEALAEVPLPENAGLILRSSCDPDEADALMDDILAMSTLARDVLADADGPAELLVEGDGPHALAWREWTDPAQIAPEPGSFETHGVADALEALSFDRVILPGGYTMIIEPTSALVAIDINTGNDTSPAAGLKANMAAMRDLPRQLRLRGLGGQIVIDPAPCPKKDRRQLESMLKAALKRETTETIVAGWTTLGLLELQRKRDRIALKALL
ncbi:ribonuclease E/G [Tropicibacter naphthalenivorans]|uniref:Ribonuclease E n=1 Tax=Tropicibacter naphthalenivorans TaxID=441103 RepID=A0A0P1G2H5_9RHOB|nr:ribonuclease E/G [Tropicibacter naphthalenivorans]CUH75819.1 Ribonuclease E [Tropicibacter naphthalenivorans]SMC42057.1 ribonuclease, Rne/Rng family [Tropicibacter naphthalenivorans]